MSLIQWRLYSCDLGHSWQFLLDANAPEMVADRICRCGHEAVMVKRVKPSDYVSVSIIPKARQLDSITGKIGYKTDFYIKVESMIDTWVCITEKSYLKEEAIAIATTFIGLEKPAASRVWKSKRLGNEGVRMELI